MIKGIIQIIFGSTIAAIPFVLGLIMIADAGYNTGDLSMMVAGGVLIVVGMFGGGLIMDIGIKNYKISEKEQKEKEK